MKTKYFHSFLAGVALIFAATACTPENEELPALDLTTADLVEGKAYRIVVDQTTNKVTMTSLLGERYITNWIHPQGSERKTSTEANIPFAGDYEIQFGVMTRGGMVYGEPYKFTLENTNGDLLTDPLWGFLTGGPDQSKTWVLDHNNYDLGSFTFMCHYMGWDKFTDGKTFTEADCPDYKTEYGYDSPDWVWQAGEPDWMFTAEQFASIPELTFDLINGAHLTVDGTTMSFVMDPDRKTLTMPAGINWLGTLLPEDFLSDMVNLELVKLNEHVLGIKVERNDGQRIVMCYVEKDWDGVWPITGPSLTTAPVQAPTYDNLLEDLFTIVGNDASYLATSVTYLLNEEMPYGYMEWNGTTRDGDGNLKGSWQWLPLYGTPACPAYDAIDEFALTISKSKGKDEDDNDIVIYPAVVESADGGWSSNFNVVENKIVFDSNMTLLITSNNDYVSGTEFTVLKCSPDDGELVIGVPASRDENGAVNRYRCVNMTVKPIGGAQTGPTVLAVDNSVLESYFDSGNYNCYRIEIYNPWGGDKTWPVDVSKLKLKKNQTIKIAFKLNGATWNSAPRAVICHNMGNGLWPGGDGAAFADASAVTMNTSGETVLSLTNTTGSSFTFDGTSCLAICIDQRGNAASPLDADGNLDATVVTAEITSITIE